MSVNLRSALLMILSMGFFAVEDALIKATSGQVPTGMIIWVIGLGGTLICLIWLPLRGVALWHPDFVHPKVLMRTGFEVVGGMFFVPALSMIPLTTVSAVVQATPLLVAMGAALFLGQKVGWRRWAAIMVGLFGVLLIIRPGLEGFEAATLLAVVGVSCLAARDIVTRSLETELTSLQLTFHAYVGLIVAGVLLMLILGQSVVVPTQQSMVFLAMAIAISICAYLAIVAATRQGDAAMTSSMRYSRMLFALVIGYFAFEEVPDAMTLIGAGIVIAAGLYTLIREARLARSGQAG